MDVDITDPQQVAALELQRSKKIANIVEAYFSDSNLLWDKLLLSRIEGDPRGFVEIAWLSRQSRLKSLKCTPQEIVAAVTTYSFPKLKLNEDHTHIAHQKPYVKQKAEELDDWSIYVVRITKSTLNIFSKKAARNSYNLRTALSGSHRRERRPIGNTQIGVG